MRTLAVSFIAFVFVSVFSIRPAPAQDEFSLSLQPDAAPGYKLTYEEYRIQELERGARRSRNALIDAAAGLRVRQSALRTAMGEHLWE